LGGIVGGTIRFLGLSFNFAGDMINRSSKYLLNQIVVFIARYHHVLENCVNIKKPHVFDPSNFRQILGRPIAYNNLIVI
jgi:hypothetical protein